MFNIVERHRQYFIFLSVLVAPSLAAAAQARMRV
jgi:hypothetical protein